MIPYVLKVAASAEEPYSFGANRNYIQLDESATVAVTIKSPDTGEQTTLKSGDYAILSPFDELRFSHDGSVDTAFTIFVGKDTRRGGSRVGGSVQVTGGSDNVANPPDVNAYPAYDRALTENHFYLSVILGLNEWTLENPAGSGKNLILYDFRQANTGTVKMGLVDVVAGSSGATFFASSINKKLGGAASVVTELRYNTTAALIFSGDIATMTSTANLAKDAAFILSPGQILGLSGTSVIPFFQWEERDV